jgi:hypothetical protein
MDSGEADKESQSKVAAKALILLLAALALQTLHEVEHLAQFYQHWWLGLGGQEAHGILFFLDVEWNHFLFNLVYFLLLAAIYFWLISYPELAALRRERSGRLGFRLFALGFLLQGYHVVEHTVRIGQLFQLGCTPCPGILGWYIDLVYLHFTINTATLLLPAALVPVLWKERIWQNAFSAARENKPVKQAS